MIRPDTKPGTEIVCISAGVGRFGPSFLTEGAVYIVEEIKPGIDSHCVFIVGARPIFSYAAPWGLVQVGYDLARFRYLEIPNCLTELLEAATIRETENV